jgi:Icc-related predicted phosphoesterase
MDDNLEISALNYGIEKLGTVCVCVCVCVCLCVHIHRERARGEGGADIGATLVANAKNLTVQSGCGSSASHCHPLFKL